MTWHAVVYWDTTDVQRVGWAWRVQNLNTGQQEAGPAISQEDGLNLAQDCLRRWGVAPDTVKVEIWDEGVWDKC